MNTTMNTKLRNRRLNVGLTQAEVARAVNIAEQAYQRYEYGKREPAVTTAIKIAKALGCTVEELF